MNRRGEILDRIDSQEYWNFRGRESYRYKGETFYTVTPIPFYYRRRALLLELIKPVIMNDAVRDVCDFGCGDGWYIRHFAGLYPGKNFYGIDISASMIERAKNAAPFAEFQVSRTGINFSNDFDLIYSIAVLAHIKDDLLPDLFTNIYGHLKTGAQFVLFEQTAAKRREGETWCRRTTGEYIAFAKNAGFEVSQRCLISFPAHNFFEKMIAPFLRRLVASGPTLHDRCISANKSILFKTISSIMVGMTCKPIMRDNGEQDGNTLYIFRKA